MADIKKLFADNGFIPAPDAELTALLDQTLQHMTEKDLVTYIEKVKKYDKQPVHVTESHPGEFLIDLNNSRPVHWWHLRKDLGILPQYFDVTEKLGLTKKEQADLLFSVADSHKYDFEGITGLIETLTKTLEDCAERGIDFKASIPQFKNFLKAARKDGDVNRDFGIIQLGVAAGMNVEQSIEIVTDIYNGRGIAGYVFMALYDELNSLGPNAASGDLIFRSLKAIMGENGQADFSAFTQLLYLAATHTDLSQAEIFEKIADQKAVTGGSGKALLPAKRRGQDEPEEDALTKAAHALIPASVSGSTELTPVIKQPADYFPDVKAKKLAHGILPYRAKRNLAEGISDLHDLMKKGHQEGAWMFDPSAETWYSLGGRTNLRPGSVRQEFFPYDVSALSSSPVFVHIHPEGNETFISPHRDSLAYPQLQKKITKFVATMPSGSDFETVSHLMTEASQKVPVSGLIVTSIGLTEMRMPNDPKRIAEFAKTFRDLKDQVLLEFDARGYLNKHGIQEPDIEFVKRLLVDLNKKLPPGFEIIVHDYNKEIELGAAAPGTKRLGAGGRPDDDKWTDSLGNRTGRRKG